MEDQIFLNNSTLIFLIELNEMEWRLMLCGDNKEWASHFPSAFLIFTRRDICEMEEVGKLKLLLIERILEEKQVEQLQLMLEFFGQSTIEDDFDKLDQPMLDQLALQVMAAEEDISNGRVLDDADFDKWFLNIKQESA